MKSMYSLRDVDLSSFHIQDVFDHYKVDIQPDSTVASLILAHLYSKPGFIQHRRAAEPSTATQETYSKALHQIVAKGAPLELYISAFSPKVTNPQVTNDLLYPDMADLLTLLHLHMVAKGIREVYDYGFRFIIGYRGYVYQSFFNWKKEDIATTYQHLHLLKEIAEEITGVRNVVRFVDQAELIEQEGDAFQIRLTEEIQSIRTDYAAKQDPNYRKINAWIRDFSKAIDLQRFASAEEKESFLLSQAIYFRALKNIQFTGGKHNLGICNSFPNVLLATIRGLDQTMSIQLNPFFRFHSHQRLIALRKDHTWMTMKWSEMEEASTSFVPIYVQEFTHPFFFQEQ